MAGIIINTARVYLARASRRVRRPDAARKCGVTLKEFREWESRTAIVKVNLMQLSALAEAFHYPLAFFTRYSPDGYPIDTETGQWAPGSEDEQQEDWNALRATWWNIAH